MVLPTASPAPPELIAVGETFDLNGDYFAAVIHIAKPNNDAIVATLVPIVYGSKEVTPGVKMELKPPKSLNIEGAWPPTQEPVPDTEEAEKADTQPAETGDPPAEN